MSITTRSVIYYGFELSLTNRNLNFNEGGPELSAPVDIGGYSLTDGLSAVQDALNVAGALTYTVSLDRSTRLVTISTTSTFALLVSTGSQSGTSIFSLMGFTGADRTGASSYTGNLPAAFELLPQFVLQDFVDKADLQEAVEAEVNESADGTVEVVKFGTRQMYEFNIRFITNIDQGSSGVIETDLSGVANARSFLQSAVKKIPFEFMKDRSNRAIFDKILLDSTPLSSKGTGYRLVELYGQGLPGYFETGTLKMRVI
jgi:hypothetical protein